MMRAVNLTLLILLKHENSRRVFVVMFLMILTACTPFIRAPGQSIYTPQLNEKEFFTSDGEILAVKSWGPKVIAPKAIIIALHGFNDYSNFFKIPGAFLANQAILSYAYDQRGFGKSKHPGAWSGTRTMVDDLKTFIHLIKQRHSGTPLYLLGESMGGALIMVAATESPKLDVDGVILSAPAVWGRLTMPWYQRLALWIGVRIMPSVAMTGEGLNIKPSDNIKMLLALNHDPFVIKKTRIDAIYGLVNLMDTALDRAVSFSESTLILYGEKDEIIPLKPTHLMLARLPQTEKKQYRLAFYKNGYHMLLRDLNAKTAWRDIVSWIKDNDLPFVSGADINAYERLSGLINKK